MSLWRQIRTGLHVLLRRQSADQDTAAEVRHYLEEAAALGCPRSQVIRLFMRDGLLLSGIGAACGIITAIGLTRLMSTLLFEVGPGDPLTYIAASAVMIFTAIIANFRTIP